MAKKKASAPTPVTYEDFLKLEFEGYSIRSQDTRLIPEPTYDFAPGCLVRLGYGTEYRVEELLEGGKLLHLSYEDKGVRRGTAYDNHRRLPHLAWWPSVTLLAGEQSSQTHFRRRRPHIQYGQSTLDTLLFRAYKRGFIESPDYQRDYVWTLRDKRRLIHSIFQQMDIGKFIFIQYEEHEKLEIVDGKQRLRAILDFVEGRFTYEGERWCDLSFEDKLAFRTLMVQYADIDREKVKRSEILWTFLSVNAAGVPQTEDHIAKARQMYEEALAEEAAEQTQA